MDTNTKNDKDKTIQENLEKIVAILDLILFRIRKLKRPYEQAEAMDEATREIILVTFNTLINTIEMARNQYEDGTQNIPSENAEDIAVGFAEHIVNQGRHVISKGVIQDSDKANITTVIEMVAQMLVDLKKERGLQNVMVTAANSEVEGYVRFNTDVFEIPAITPTRAECIKKIAQIEWITANFKSDDNVVSYLTDKLALWKEELNKKETN